MELETAAEISQLKNTVNDLAFSLSQLISTLKVNIERGHIPHGDDWKLALFGYEERLRRAEETHGGKVIMYLNVDIHTPNKPVAVCWRDKN